MKRSKALYNIGSEVCLWLYDYQIEGINIEKVDNLNKRILSKLESLGMLPPFNENLDMGDIGHEWEPEDVVEDEKN